MRMYKGLLFILIALVSLGVILLWPHAKYPSRYSVIGGYEKGDVSPHGLPLTWLKIESGVSAGTADPTYTEKKYEEKHIHTTNLLINLIIWGALMLGVELILRGYYKKRGS